MANVENVLVTGGGGFIGTWVLKELFDRGAQPIVYDLRNGGDRWQRILGDNADQVVFVEGDLTNREALSRACSQHDVTRIIHLAALLTPNCQTDPWFGCQVNVLGSMTIFEQARLNDAIQSVSYASSLAVFGPEPDDLSSLDPNIDPTYPPSFYGAFKRSLELIARQYWLHFQVPSFGLRPHVVYGPERTIGLTAGPSLAAKAAANNESHCINYSGPAGYDYVEDVALAFVLGALETPLGSNVCDMHSEVATTSEIAELVHAASKTENLITVTGDPIPSNKTDTPNHINRLFPDWKTTSIALGLQKTVEFYAK